MIISVEQEDNMIVWLKVNKCLFNKKLNDYKDTKNKNHLWSAKAEELKNRDSNFEDLV